MKLRKLIRSALIALIVLIAAAVILPGGESAPAENEGHSSGSEEVHLPDAAFQSSFAPSAAVLPEDSSFEIYFLDVGQGDAAVVLCDGKAMLIDGGSREQSSRIYSFLNAHGITHLDYVVASHPDADHVGGLSGALHYASVGAALCTTAHHDTESFGVFLDSLAKQNVPITVPDAGARYPLGNAVFTVIGPEADTVYSDNTSLILRIEYGDTSFLFAGDAETADEQAAIASGHEIKSTVLKVSHHGSDSSSSYRFIYNVEPAFAVISVGGENSYGHPADAVLSRLHDADVTSYRTDMQGDIHCTSDGKTVVFDVQKNTDIDTYSAAGGYTNWLAAETVPAEDPTAQGSGGSADPGSGTTYVVNTNSGKFHYSWCASVGQMNEENKAFIDGTHDELVAMGYSPCGRCHP